MLFLVLVKQPGHTTQAEQITLGAEACDDPISPFGDERMMAEFLALVHVEARSKPTDHSIGLVA